MGCRIHREAIYIASSTLQGEREGREVIQKYNKSVTSVKRNECFEAKSISNLESRVGENYPLRNLPFGLSKIQGVYSRAARRSFVKSNLIRATLYVRYTITSKRYEI